VYTRDQLFAIQPARLSNDVNNHLRSLGIGTGLPRKRKAKTTKPISNHLKWMCFNVQTCRQKCITISELICDNDLDFAMLTETWLYPDGDEAYVNAMTPHGYDCYSFPRQPGSCFGTRGGGIAIITKSTLSTNFKLTRLVPTSFEAVECKLSINQVTLSCICIYRPPYRPANKMTDSIFVLELSDFLASYTTCTGDVSFTGDFNLHFNDDTDACVKRMKTVLFDLGLSQVITVPTHKSGNTIDWLIVRDDKILTNLDNVREYPGFSDHYAIFGHIAIAKPPPNTRLVTTRNLRAVNIETLRADITELIAGVKSDLDVQSLANIYEDGLKRVLDRQAPLVTRRVRIRPSAPWLTSQVRDARRKRRRAERLWKKTKLTIHRDMFVDARNKASHSVFLAKRDYYSDKIDSPVFNTKQLFNVSNELLKKGKSSCLPSNIPSADLPFQFSKFFSDKIKNLRDDLDSRHCEPPSFKVYEGPVFDRFRSVSENEISELIKSTPTKGCILDPLPTQLVKECIVELVPLITCIINTSFRSGVVPSQFKQAVVVPILKKSSLDCNSLKNFRPVSNLPFISKILEKVVLKQLQKHLCDNGLFEVNQSAYRSGHSVETAVLSVLDGLLINADNKMVSLVALLDLSSAFDTLDHSILLKRLEISFGIKENVHAWFTSYVYDRFQSVIVNSLVSDQRPLTYGVPQGSVLGPVLFTLYSQPLSNVIEQYNCSFHKYADDTELSQCSTLDDFVSTQSSIQDCISATLIWLESNKLMLNTDKTELMTVGTASRVNQIDIKSIQILDSDISFQDSVKYLGVKLDRTLSMSAYISDVCRSAFLSLRRIGSIRPFLSEKATACLVNSVIISRLDFCNSVLYGLPADQLNRLQRIQNCAARLIAKKKKYDHVTPILTDLHWLPVRFRIQYKLAVFAFRHFDGTLPPYLSSSLNIYQPRRSLRSSSQMLLTTPRVNLKAAGERSFHFSAPAVWNSLPFSLRSTPMLAQFKVKLKTHLFHEAFQDS
jgi:hypothetical protein